MIKKFYILLMLFTIITISASEELNTVSNTQAQEKSYKSKGLLNPFIDNIFADDSVKSHMAIKYMRLDELYPKIEQYLSKGYLEYAKVALERVITIEKNQTKLKDARSLRTYCIEGHR